MDIDEEMKKAGIDIQAELKKHDPFMMEKTRLILKEYISFLSDCMTNQKRWTRIPQSLH